MFNWNYKYMLNFKIMWKYGVIKLWKIEWIYTICEIIPQSMM